MRSSLQLSAQALEPHCLSEWKINKSGWAATWLPRICAHAAAHSALAAAVLAVPEVLRTAASASPTRELIAAALHTERHHPWKDIAWATGSASSKFTHFAGLCLHEPQPRHTWASTGMP